MVGGVGGSGSAGCVVGGIGRLGEATGLNGPVVASEGGRGCGVGG